MRDVLIGVIYMEFIYVYFEMIPVHTRLYVWPAFCLCLSSLTTLGCSPRAVVSQVWQWDAVSRIAGLWSWRWSWRCIRYVFHDRRVYSYETCIILICIYWQMLYIVSVASACDVSYLYTIHLFCSCICILIISCYSCDVSCLNLFYIFMLFYFTLKDTRFSLYPRNERAIGRRFGV